MEINTNNPEPSPLDPTYSFYVSLNEVIDDGPFPKLPFRLPAYNYSHSTEQVSEEVIIPFSFLRHNYEHQGIPGEFWKLQDNTQSVSSPIKLVQSYFSKVIPIDPPFGLMAQEMGMERPTLKMEIIPEQKLSSPIISVLQMFYSNPSESLAITVLSMLFKEMESLLNHLQTQMQRDTKASAPIEQDSSDWANDSLIMTQDARIESFQYTLTPTIHSVENVKDSYLQLLTKLLLASGFLQFPFSKYVQIIDAIFPSDDLSPPHLDFKKSTKDLSLRLYWNSK